MVDWSCVTIMTATWTARCLEGCGHFRLAAGQIASLIVMVVAMHSHQHKAAEGSSVSVTQFDHEWRVAIEEPGFDPVIRSFKNEEWAWNFAQVQAMRLRIGG